MKPLEVESAQRAGGADFGLERDALWVHAIIATQRIDATCGRLICDVEELLHFFNGHKPQQDESAQRVVGSNAGLG